MKVKDMIEYLSELPPESEISVTVTPNGKTESVKKQIAQFLEAQRDKERTAKKKEKKRVCIKPESYMGREILYQTGLLHRILEEAEELRSMLTAAKAEGKDVLVNEWLEQYGKMPSKGCRKEGKSHEEN